MRLASTKGSREESRCEMEASGVERERLVESCWKKVTKKGSEKLKADPFLATREAQQER